MANGALRVSCIVDDNTPSPTHSELAATPLEDAPAGTGSGARCPEAEPATDDVMALYLWEISRIPLLSAEEELLLARQIERGRRAARRLKSRPALPEGERARLEQWVAEGAQARKQLISANFRLVVSIAKRYAGLGVSLPDLIQEGNIGLIRAVEKFDPSRGYKLSTYATWWIRQAITRALAEQGRMIRLPVHTCERLSQVIRAARALAQELGREPDLAEIALHTGLSVSKVKAILNQAQQPLSLDMPVGEGHDGLLADFVEDDPGQSPPEATWATFLRSEMQEVRGCLSAREDRVLELRYGLRDGHSYTLDEVGSRFGLTRERIRQIEAQALGKLRQASRSRRLVDYLA